MTIAVIFIPAALQVAEHASQCLAYCAARGYRVAGVVHTDWAAVMAVLTAQAAEVVVVADSEHLDPERTPRIEVVANAATSRYESRTRLIRRGGAR